MDKVIINSYEDFEKLVGQEIGVSDYVEVSQERINLFADATLDHQWIHVKPQKRPLCRRSMNRSAIRVSSIWKYAPRQPHAMRFFVIISASAVDGVYF